jgi:quinol monooxygenase YgiN
MDDARVSMTVRWRVSAAEVGPIASALQVLMMQARGERGCAGCSFTTEIGELVVIAYVERWESEDHLREQVRSERFQRLAELIEHATDTPLIEFALPGRTRALDYAEEVRAQPYDW